MSFPLYGCDADAVASADEALGQLQLATYDWVVSDVRMPGRTGVELAHILRARFPGVGVVLMTAYELTPEETVTAKAMDVALVIKPVTAEALAIHFAQAAI